LLQKRLSFSAGALKSPQLLILSGIGDSQKLQNLSIPIVANISALGVGKNLNEHLQVQMSFRYNQAQIPPDPTVDQVIGQQINYCKYRTGLFSGRGQLTMQAFVSSTGNPSNPDIQVIPGGPAIRASQLAEVYDIRLQRSVTRGTLEVTSSNPLAAPTMDLSNILDEDIGKLVWGIEWVRNLTKFAPYNETLEQEISPGANITGDLLTQWVTRTLNGDFHYTSTCIMENSNVSNEAVVDSQLRVKGVSNLRVADISVLLLSGNGNIYASALMVGEKAADLILNSQS